MAVRNFSSAASSTTWNNAGNWDTAPGAGDVCHIFATSSQSISGADYSGTALAGVIVGPGYTGNIGSSGSPLKLNLDYLIIEDYQGTAAWLELSNGGNPILVVVNSTKTTTSPSTEGLHIASVASASDLLTVYQSGGYLTIGDGSTTCYLSSLYASGGYTYVKAAMSGTVIVQTVNPEDADITGPFVETSSAIPTLECLGGRITHKAGNITTRAAAMGGDLRFENSAAMTITLLEALSSSVNLTNLGYALTITNANLMEGDIDARGRSRLITWSNNPKHRGSGSVLADLGYAPTPAHLTAP